MKESILATLINATDDNYIDTIINFFSYEERLNFYNEMYLTKDETLYSKLKYVLTSEEISNIIQNKFGHETVNSMLDSNKKRYLISLFNSLDINGKVKEFLKLDKSLMVYSCNKIFDTDELKSNFIEKIDKNTEITGLKRVIISIINNIEDFDIRLQTIDKIIYSLGDMSFIPPLNEKNFGHYFNDLKLSELTKACLITKCIDAQVAKKYFFELNDDDARIFAFKRFSNDYINRINDLLDNNTEYINNNFSFEDKKEMLLSIKNDKVLSVKYFSNEEKFDFIPLLAEEEKVELLTQITDSKVLFKGINYLNDISSITEVLSSFEGTFPSYNENYKKLVVLYSKMFGVNTEHLIEFSKLFSLKILTKLDNKNILSLIDLNDKDFNKLVMLFNQNNTKLNSYSLNNIFDAFANKSFNINFDYVKHYFTNTMLFVRDYDGTEAKKIIRKVLLGLEDELQNKYNIEELYKLLRDNDEKTVNEFHELCNRYIDKIRKEEVQSSINMYTDEYLDTMFEASSSIKAIMNYGTPDWLYTRYLSKIMDLFSPREKELLEDKELFKQIYNFKLNIPLSLPPIIKTNMFTFNKIMDKFYSEFKNDTLIQEILENSSIKKVPVIPDVDYQFLIDILSSFDAEELKRSLLDDDSLCNGLNKLLKKYNFLAFNNQFEEIQLDADTYCDSDAISSIFLNYKKIIEDIKSTNIPINMSSILDISDTYSKSSEVYKSILGEENFKLITLNLQPNRASSLRKQRREASIKNYISSYNRTKVSIPAFDEDIGVNNKKINVVVGNFTNPINLSLGERTESCMRSGGVGEELYEFCLNDDKGFHIILNDSKTGEFISRVSGFRNGNTVFLNQLRESVLDNYNNDDLIKICKIVADELVERSKDSEYPIDNVVISHDKAMEDYEGETINLKSSNIFYGFDKTFWFDLIPNNCILLSSSDQNNSLVPLKLGPSNITYYPVIRDKIRIAKHPNEGINHIESLEQLLTGKGLENIKLDNNEYEVCYYGEDWYVAVTKDGKIVKKIMSKSKNFERAFEEMSVTLNNIEKVEKIFNETSYKK